MFSFGKSRLKSNKKNVALVFDIGSASVAGGLVALDDDSVPHLLYTVRKKIVFQKNLNFERFVSSMAEAFAAVLENIERKGLQYINKKQLRSDSISTALFVYASPWYSALTKIFMLSKEKPFIVTKGLVSKLIKKEETSSLEEHGSGLEKVQTSGDVIERSITTTKINGYSITHVEGKEAKQLELTVSTTVISHSVAQNLEEIFERVFNGKNIIHHSFPLAAFITMRDIFHDLDNFLILDVSGEVSDLSLVKDNSLLETASFPIGKHSVTRRLMDKLDVSSAEAESALQMYMENFIHEQVSEKISNAIQDIRSEWSKEFEKAIERIEDDLLLPSKLFFIADKSFMGLVENFIEYADRENKFDLEPIGCTTLRDYVDFSGARTHDPFLGIATYFLNKTLQ